MLPQHPAGNVLETGIIYKIILFNNILFIIILFYLLL